MGEQPEQEQKQDQSAGAVVAFDPDRLKPHTSGWARCTRCRYEWVAVVLAKNRNEFLECPKCGDVTGRFPYAYVPNKEQMVWQCSCGNDVFFVLNTGRILCPGCGEFSDLPSD